jgi:hypothetical protein
MEAGSELGLLARQLYPGGVEAPYVGLTSEAADLATAAILGQNPSAIYEATFVANGMMARVDVLVRDPNGWRIVEVKSSKEYKKPSHLPDVAFQAIVLEAAGVPVTGYEVVHLDGSFVGSGSSDTPASLFRATDITRDVIGEMAKTRALAESLLVLWDRPDYPSRDGASPYFDPGLRSVCRDCDFSQHCMSLAPDDDLLYLGLSQKTSKELRSQGVTRAGAIPVNTRLSPLEVLRLEAQRTGQPQVSPDLAEMLGAIRYPAHLIDFETVAEAIPFLPGLRPYEPIPFQWSSHTVASAKEALSGDDRRFGHREFLFTGDTDPRPAFVASLIELLDGEGSILHYSPYERTTIRQLVEAGIPRSEELQELVADRLIDLCDIVKKGFAHPDFRGLTSIKVVLPVVAPSVSYKDLAIGEGDQAQKQYMRAFSHSVGPEEREQIFRDLLEYCQLDTWAMVLVLRHLLSVNL